MITPENGCKHARRVAIEINATELPAPGQDATEFMESLGVKKREFVKHVEELLEEYTLYEDFIRAIEDYQE
jgi:hypothetical protein